MSQMKESGRNMSVSEVKSTIKSIEKNQFNTQSSSPINSTIKPASGKGDGGKKSDAASGGFGRGKRG